MISQLVNGCRQSGIDFSLGSGGKLKINADKSALTPVKLSEIKAVKNEIVAFLKAEEIDELDQHFQASVLNRADILKRLNLTEQQIDGFYPLVPLQESMLLQHMLSEQSDAYITYFILILEDKLVFDRIMECFKSVVERHASCRTAIIWRGVEQAYQLVKKEASIPITYVHCANEDDYQQKLQTLQSQNRAMDLEQGALMRFHVLLKANTQEHVLFIERHHIVSDHISLELTLYELLMFYQQKQSQLLPARQQYEFALKHNTDKSVDARYFDDLLDGFNAPTLLFDLDKTHIEAVDIEEFSYQFPSDLQQSLRQQSRQLGVSPAVLFHYAWAIVMAKFCNSKDVLFPTVLTGRMMAPEYRTTIGMFLNSLPLRVKLDERSVAEQLNDINIQLMQLCQHEKLPLNQAIQKLTDEFGTVFNCIFNYRHSTEETLLDELPFEHLVTKDESTTPFSLSISETDEVFIAELEAYHGVNGYDLLQSLELALDYIVNELAKGNNAPFQMPVLLSSEQINHQLYDLNDTVQSYPKDKCIHELFERHAVDSPNRVAVVFEDTQLTYRELNEKSNQLAHYLKENHSIGPDCLVGICVERSLDMMIGILGILKAGGAYVPLDPNYPQERLNYMIVDTGMNVVLSQKQTTAVLASFSGKVVALDGLNNNDNHFCMQYPNCNLAKEKEALESSNLAYVIYTSGSTGKPKGVMVEHSALVNYQQHIKQQYDITLADNILQFSNISFDIFIEEFFGALCQGAQLTLRNDACTAGIKAFIDFCQQHQVTVISLPTSYWTQLVCEAVTFDDISLKVVVVGGETLSVSAVKKHYQIFGTGVKLINTYGPTEATITATAYTTTIDDSDLKAVSIGRPNINNQILILDNDNQLCPFNCAGELYIGGEGLARAYLNQPELTQRHFVDNPYYDATEVNSPKRLYRTGDLVRYAMTGELLFLGRIDDQVKIRGFRIETGEVEVQIDKLPFVESALVITSQKGEALQLIAYVKLDPDKLIETKEQHSSQIKVILRDKLPAYMVPDVIVIVSEWPLTQNGKVNRKALPMPETTFMHREYIAPKTESELMLVNQIAKMLEIDVDNISVSDNFIEIGGNSILCLRLAQFLGAELNIESPLSLIFEAGNIAELSLEIDLIVSIQKGNVEEHNDNMWEEEW